ncbi:MAG: hypothetical protein R3C32_06615 [Chloroflexota bacterium]
MAAGALRAARHGREWLPSDPAAGVQATALAHEQVRFRSRFSRWVLPPPERDARVPGLDADGGGRNWPGPAPAVPEHGHRANRAVPSRAYPVLRDPQAHPSGAGPAPDPARRHRARRLPRLPVEGTSTVLPDGIRYDLVLPAAGVRYRLHGPWRSAALRLDVERPRSDRWSRGTPAPGTSPRPPRCPHPRCWASR